jgi:hypothetical protein
MKKVYWVGSYADMNVATTKPKASNNDGYKELACAVMRETVREYFERGTTAKKQAQIIKELRSKWCEFLTDGLSIYLAEQLIKNPEAVHIRFRKEYEEEMR